MSILLKKEIKKKFKSGEIHISPFNKEQLGPNSYDVYLSNKLLVYKNFPLKLDTYNETEEIILNENTPFVLQPGVLYLGSTVEEIGSDYYIPMYEGRSSMARLGIQSHISAGFGDVGFKSQWTLEIMVAHPVEIKANVKIGQIYFNTINNKKNKRKNRYHGKYATQSGPTSSLSFLDYKK